MSCGFGGEITEITQRGPGTAGTPLRACGELGGVGMAPAEENRAELEGPGSQFGFLPPSFQRLICIPRVVAHRSSLVRSPPALFLPYFLNLRTSSPSPVVLILYRGDCYNLPPVLHSKYTSHPSIHLYPAASLVPPSVRPTRLSDDGIRCDQPTYHPEIAAPPIRPAPPPPPRPSPSAPT